jgi:hypothetical protein
MNGSVDLLHPTLASRLEVHRGIVVDVAADGVVRVHSTAGETSIPCDVLSTGNGKLFLRPGDPVIFLFARETPERGCILGSLRNPEGTNRNDGAIDSHEVRGRRVTIEGSEEVVLKTGKAMIVLRENGDIEILGRRIVSRATLLQKLLAPMLKLN